MLQNFYFNSAVIQQLIYPDCFYNDVVLGNLPIVLRGDSSNVSAIQLRLEKANPSSLSLRHSANYF